MRWSFASPFRGKPRAASADPGSSGSQADGGAVAPGAARPGPHEPVGDRGAWRELPPLEPTLAPAPLTAASGSFATDVAGGHRPEPILRPLGHDRTADGPGGLVGGLVTPVVGSSVGTAGGTDLPGLSRTPVASRRVGRTGPAPAAEMPADTTPALPRADAGSLSVNWAEAAARPLANVPPEAREVRRQLTAVRADTVQPAVAGVRAPETGAVGAGSVGAPSDPARMAADGPTPGSPAAPGAGAPALPLHAGVVRRTFATGAPGRRAGLGAPIQGTPPVMSRPLDRPALAPSSSPRSEASARPPVPPAIGGAELPLAMLGQPAAARSGVATASPLETPMSGGGASTRRAPITAQRAADPSLGSAAPGGQPAAQAELPLAPLSGTRPESLAVTGRGGETLAPSSPAPSSAPSPGPHTPPSDAGAGPGLARAATPRHPETGAAGTATTPSRPALQRLTASPATQGVRQPAIGPSLATSANRTIGRLRRRGRGGSRARRAVGPHWQRRRLCPVRWTLSPRCARLAGGGDARCGGPRRSRRRVVTCAAASGAAPDRARPPHGRQGRRTDVPLQRAVTVDEISVAPTEAPQPAGGATGPSGAAGAAGGQAGAAAGVSAVSEADLDLLARRLYGRVRDRLARELLLDRERSGMLADR